MSSRGDYGSGTPGATTHSNTIGSNLAQGGSWMTTPPEAPVIGTATYSAGNVTLTFSTPASATPILGYVVTDSLNKRTLVAVSPATVPVQRDGFARTFNVYAINGGIRGPESAQSNSITPV